MHLVTLNENMEVVLSEELSPKEVCNHTRTLVAARQLSSQIALDNEGSRSVSTEMPAIVPADPDFFFETLVIFDEKNYYRQTFLTFDEAIDFHNHACRRIFDRNGTVVYKDKKHYH